MDPVLVRVPWIDLPIQSYPAMLVLAFVAGWVVVVRRGRRRGFDPALAAATFTWTAIAAMVGSRVLYIAANLPEFRGASVLEIVNIRNGGIVAYGGFLGGLAGSWLYLRLRGRPLLPWADLAAPALAVGLGITRIGCHLQGCDYGRPVAEDAPGWIRALAVRFPNWEVAFPKLEAEAHAGLGSLAEGLHGAPAYLHHVRLGLVEAGSATSLPVYPTQLLESAVGWTALALLLVVRRRQRYAGQLILVLAAYYGVLRFLLEMLRGDTQRGGLGPFSTSQLVAMATVATVAVVWPILARRAPPLGASSPRVVGR